MSIPTWSGDEHTLGTFRYRVLWFRVLLVTGVTTGLVSAFGMGYRVGQHEVGESTPSARVSAPANLRALESELGGARGYSFEFTDCCEDEAPARPISAASRQALLAEARLTEAAGRAEREREEAKNAPVVKLLRESQVSLNFDAVPLGEAIDFLRDTTKLNLALSRDAVSLVEHESVEVNLRLKAISLENAIKLILASHEELTFEVRDALVWITTSEDVKAEPLVKAYAVHDLVGGDLGDEGGLALDADVLIELIDELSPDQEGRVECTGGVLLVRAQAARHAQITGLLSALRGVEPPAYSEPDWVRKSKVVLRTRPVTLNFPDTPLMDVIGFLRDISGLNLALGSEVDGDELLTRLRVRELPLEDALRLIVEQHDLTWTYVNETILITEHDAAPQDLCLKVYDVRDLRTWLAAESLDGLVRESLGGVSWDDPVTLRVHRGQLILNQTRERHRRIEQVLAQLRVSHAESSAALDRQP